MAGTFLLFFASTVQSGNFRHVCESRSIEHLAEWLKSRWESGGNTPILRFSYFGHLFQFLGSILVLKCLSRTGNCDSISEIDLILMFWYKCVEHGMDFLEWIAWNRMLGMECLEQNVQNGMPNGMPNTQHGYSVYGGGCNGMPIIQYHVPFVWICSLLLLGLGCVIDQLPCYCQDGNSTVDSIKPSDAQRESWVMGAGEKGETPRGICHKCDTREALRSESIMC